MNNIIKIKETLKQITNENGCRLFGSTNVEKIKDSFNIEPREILSDMNYAISFGYVLSKRILLTNLTSPSKIYAAHYKKINILLDITALKISDFLQGAGFEALPVQASQLLDFKKFTAHLSHRKIACMSGLGWFGKNNLLINPDFGAGVRYVSVLTNCPIPDDKPLSISCPPECNKCRDTCPANAIGDSPDDFNLQKCIDKLTVFSREQGIGQHICGVCVNACNKPVK